MIKSEIINLRNEIDQIDEAIAKLLSKRVDCAVKIGYLKDSLRSSEENIKIPAFDPIRENEIIERLNKIAPTLPLNGIEIIFRQIISLCRNSAHKACLCLYGKVENFDYKTFFGLFCDSVMSPDINSWLKELEKSEFNIGLTSIKLDEKTEKELILLGFKQVEFDNIYFNASTALKVFIHR